MSAKGHSSELSHADEEALAWPRRGWASLAIWLAMCMAVLDGVIANVALPTIARDLAATPAASVWIVNSYQIATTMSLLPVAALGEIVGYKRVYLVGLALFVIASFGCAEAHALGALDAARFMQGFGAAAVMAVNGALLRFTFPKRLLGRAISQSTLVVAVTSAAGPSIAAAILSLGSWRWLFAINVPIGLLSLLIGSRCLPSRVETSRRFDTHAALLNALAFGALFLGASALAAGQLTLRTALMLGISAIGFWALIRRAKQDPAPLVPLDLMRNPALYLSYLSSICSFASQAIALIAVPFYFQKALGLDPVATGLLMTPWPCGTAIASPIVGRLLERLTAGTLCCVGLLIAASGLGMLGLWSPRAGTTEIAALMAVCGAGFGVFQTPNNRTMLSQAPLSRIGAAAGMLATSRLIGLTTGATLVALLFRLSSPARTLPLFVAAVLSALGALVSSRRSRIISGPGA